MYQQIYKLRNACIKENENRLSRIACSDPVLLMIKMKYSESLLFQRQKHSRCPLAFQ